MYIYMVGPCDEYMTLYMYIVCTVYQHSTSGTLGTKLRPEAYSSTYFSLVEAVFHPKLKFVISITFDVSKVVEIFTFKALCLLHT